MKNTRSFIGLIAVVGLILLLVSTYQPANTQANNQIIVYTIDRAAVPLLYHNDLTLIVNVGDAQSISVLDENGSAIPFQAGPAAQEITFSTDSDTVRLNLNTVQPSPSLGEFRKAPLKNNFLWAYSHGFDDNYGLDDTRNAFLERDVPATYNIVADWVKVIPGWPGDFTPAELDEILDAGWGLNNHTWDHEMADFEGANGCSDTSLTYADRKADVLATADRLEQILTASTRPDYFITGFSIPCGGPLQMRDYPRAIEEIRESGEKPLLFYESGWDFPPYMDAGSPFDLEQDIVRDGRIDGPLGQLNEIKAQFDEISSLAKTNDKPYWYNSFSHGYTVFGDNTDIMASMLDYLLQTYGRDGSNEVWIAPSDEIFAYLAVRDKSVVTSDLANNATPIPTPTITQTPIVNLSCGDLLNGDFELGLQNWEESGVIQPVAGRSGNGVSLVDGFITQQIEAAGTVSLTLTGYFKVENLDPADTGRWVGFGVDYLDAQGNELSEDSIQINAAGDDFIELTLQAETVSATSQVRVWVFSSNSTPLIFDDLSLQWDGCSSSLPTPIPTLTQSPTQTPRPTGTINPPSISDYFLFLPFVQR